jgi:hypothetical protein
MAPGKVQEKSPRVAKIGGVQIGAGNPLALIAGPCVIESREHSLAMARKLKAIAEQTGAPLGSYSVRFAYWGNASSNPPNRNNGFPDVYASHAPSTRCGLEHPDRLTTDPSFYDTPVWSPDGQRIVAVKGPRSKRSCKVMPGM